jgi:hypothetical protein
MADGKIHLFVGDLNNEHDKEEAERILNSDYIINEKKVSSSAKGDVIMFIEYLDEDQE